MLWNVSWIMALIVKFKVLSLTFDIHPIWQTSFYLPHFTFKPGLMNLYQIPEPHVSWHEQWNFKFWPSSWPKKELLVPKRRNMQWNHKRSLKKNINCSLSKAAYSEHSIAIHSISMVGYVTLILAFIHGMQWAQEVNRFCHFRRMAICNFTAFFPLTYSNLCCCFFW